MKKGLVILDSGPIFSLAIVNQLEILNKLFDETYIPNAVYEEITKDQTTEHYQRIADYFQGKIKEISGSNELTFVMDYGESEAVVLYRELNAAYLLIDDKKAREIAVNYGIQCIGTLGILSVAREKGLVKELRTLFEAFLKNKRYYSLDLLNSILTEYNEEIIELQI